jgi:hypothetical protein
MNRGVQYLRAIAPGTSTRLVFDHGSLYRARQRGPRRAPRVFLEDRVARSVTRQARRALGAIAFAAVFVSLAGSSSLAATLQHHTGTIGPARFTDTSDKAGAECTYEGAAGTQYFSGMKLRGPRVKYPNLDAQHEDYGKVGYKIQLQHQSGSGPWQNYVTSPEVKLTAYDDVWFKFPVRTQNWSGATSLGGKWRAEVILTWYNGDHSIKGTGYWTIDHYTRDYNGSVGSSCKGRWSQFG